MTLPHDLRHLTQLASELLTSLREAETAGDRARAGQLRRELALLEDLALPEAVGELRLQRIAYRAVERAMGEPLPAGLSSFVG